MYSNTKITVRAKTAKQARTLLDKAIAAGTIKHSASSIIHPNAKNAKRVSRLHRFINWLSGSRRLREANARLRKELNAAQKTIKSVCAQNDRVFRCIYYAREALDGRHPKL